MHPTASLHSLGNPLISALCPPSRGTPRTARQEGQVCQDLQRGTCTPSLTISAAKPGYVKLGEKLQLAGAQTWELQSEFSRFINFHYNRVLNCPIKVTLIEYPAKLVDKVRCYFFPSPLFPRR